MKIFILSAFILTSTSLLAQGRPNVLLVDPDIEVEDLHQRYNIHRPRLVNTLPNKEVRDELLDGVSATAKWDELKKDIFYMDLRSKELPLLRKKYPELNEQTLKQLKEKVQ